MLKEVEVRSGPSKKFYPTSKLALYDKVLVLRESKEAPGWLEIKPPKGSFSWINGKFVKQVDARHGFVDCDPTRPVQILPGSKLVTQEPNRESMKLTTGTVVVVVDRPENVNGETWLPIEPHPSEVRYLPAEAVKPASVVDAAEQRSRELGTLPRRLYRQQDPRRCRGRPQGQRHRPHRQLFQIVANNATDQSQKFYALNKLANLPQASVPGTTTSLSPAAALTPATNFLTLQPAAWTTYGRLRNTKVLADNGQPLYALEDAQGRTVTYVTTIAGKSLKDYIGRTVSLFGPTMYRPDSAVRMQFVMASHVAVP